MTWQRVLTSHPLAPEAGRPEFWETYLAEHPDVLNRLLADLYQATYGSDKPPTLAELWELVETQRFAVVPFGEAVLDLLGKRSIRWLAGEVGTSHPQLSKYLSGRRPIVSVHDTAGSMQRIETIAKALKVHPSYFVEWRRLWLMSLLDSAFATKPSLSIGLFRRFAGFETGRGNARSQGGS